VTLNEVSQTLDWMRQLYTHEGIPWNEALARRAVEQVTQHPEYGGVWLIQADGIVVGYFALTVAYSLEFGGRFGLLDEFFVAEEWRCRGLGTQALNFALDWCRAQDFAALRLEVDPQNLRGQKLYRRMGFDLQERYLMTRWST
jgi:GNAT superfamily N-acetyltransferase